MTQVFIAARDSSPADRADADFVCDGKADVAVLTKALAEPDHEVELRAGPFDPNAGFTSVGNRYMQPAENVTFRGAEPGLTRIVADREPCRIAVDAPGVTLANFGGFGYVGVQDTADRLTCEDMYVTYSLDGSSYLDFGRQSRCTAAFMVWGRRGRRVRDLTFRRCSVERSYHHGFSSNLNGASEDGGFSNISMTSGTRSLAAPGLRAPGGTTGPAASTSRTPAMSRV